MVDVRKAFAEYREISVRRQEVLAQEYFFESSVPNRSKRLSVYNWNPGPRRGKEGNGILSPCRMRLSMLTTSSPRTVPRNSLRGMCSAVRQGYFFADVKVKSIYLHDTRRGLPDKVMEGDSGWVLQGVLSRASFRRQPLSGLETFTVLSLHITNVHAEKRGIGKELILAIRTVMLKDNVDVVAGDFKGAAWRRDNINNISTIEEVFAECALPMPPGPTPLWAPGSIPGNWADVFGFLEPPEPDRHWKVRLHGVFFIPRDVLGLRPNDRALGIRPTDQRCHHEAWLHLDFVGWHDVQNQRDKHDQRILLKERSSPYHYGKKIGRISDIMSDHSLSSWHRDHSCTLVRRSTSRVLCASKHKWSSMEDPVVLLERKFVRSSFGRTFVRKGIWSTVGKRFPVVNAYSYTVKKGCVCGWHEIGWKETKHWSDVESSQQRSRFGRTNIFPGSCTLGMQSKDNAK